MSARLACVTNANCSSGCVPSVRESPSPFVMDHVAMGMRNGNAEGAAAAGIVRGNVKGTTGLVSTNGMATIRRFARNKRNERDVEQHDARGIKLYN